MFSDFDVKLFILNQQVETVMDCKYIIINNNGCVYRNVSNWHCLSGARRMRTAAGPTYSNGNS